MTTDTTAELLSLNDFEKQIFHAFSMLPRLNLNSLYHDLTQGEYLLMFNIFLACRETPDSPGIFVSELARCQMVSPSAVSRMLQSLERRQLIKRHVNPDDRRNTYVNLTEQGCALLAEEKRRSDQVTKYLVAAMGEDKLLHFSDLLNELLQTLIVGIAKQTGR